mgnify:CR=1 FL=1
MLKKLVTFTIVVVLCLLPALEVPAAVSGLSDEQIDNLLAPIALYPDPLLAQMLPASTFVDQIDKAARYLRGNKDQTTGIDNQNWDVSVRSTAHYPQVIYMMSDKIDWTTALGQAYVNQSTDVMKSIQRLRAQAKAAGNLNNSPQQTVVVEKEVIKIVPASPTVIYVPVYNPQVVYVQSGPSPGAVAALAFGTGLIIGAWLNNDCDWYGYRVYYHGWHGTGWVRYSSVHVHINNNYYVNSRYSTIRVNRAVVNRPVHYDSIPRYSNVHRNVNYTNVNVNRNDVNINSNNRTNYNQATRRINASNPKADTYRGRTNGPQASTMPANGPSSPSNRSAWGGFGNRSEATMQTQRGQASRKSTGELSPKGRNANVTKQKRGN